MTLIETLVAAPEGSVLASAIKKRAEIFRLTDAAHDAVLLPKDPGGLSRGLRAALAARMARQHQNVELTAHYDSLVANVAEAATAPLAEPGTTVPDPRTAEIVRHSDRLTVAPRDATRAHIEALQAVGVGDADIVRLAELAAFVSYQVRVLVGLKLLGEMR